MIGITQIASTPAGCVSHQLPHSLGVPDGQAPWTFSIICKSNRDGSTRIFYASNPIYKDGMCSFRRSAVKKDGVDVIYAMISESKQCVAPNLSPYTSLFNVNPTEFKAAASLNVSADANKNCGVKGSLHMISIARIGDDRLRATYDWGGFNGKYCSATIKESVSGPFNLERAEQTEQ